MRAKKKILLIDADETRCSVRGFVLSNRGFRVYPVARAGDARRAAASVDDLDLIMLCWPFRGARALLDELHRIAPGASSMVIADALKEAPLGLFACVILLDGQCSQAEITERAKMLCARKRGARKLPQPERAAAIAELV